MCIRDRYLPRYTVTYCQYGDNRMKPTDIWTNHPCPKFKPPCKNGDPCHVSAPRGSQTGTQGLKAVSYTHLFIAWGYIRLELKRKKWKFHRLAGLPRFGVVGIRKVVFLIYSCV